MYHYHIMYTADYSSHYIFLKLFLNIDKVEEIDSDIFAIILLGIDPKIIIFCNCLYSIGAWLKKKMKSDFCSFGSNGVSILVVSLCTIPRAYYPLEGIAIRRFISAVQYSLLHNKDLTILNFKQIIKLVVLLNIVINEIIWRATL